MTCPHCDRRIDVEVEDPARPTRNSQRSPTYRGIAQSAATIRDDAPTCAACGLVRALHEGGSLGDSLAWARYGCDAFVERA